MHGAARAAAGVVFGLLSPAWRLDPAATATVGPVMMAVRVVKAGTVSAVWWQRAMDAVGADARSLSRGGLVA
eukprot:1660475-Lingulodinium_polyedra.AAC.1